MNMCLFPFTLVLMFGRMLKQMRHAWVIFGVMMSLMILMIVWAVGWDTLQPNPALQAHDDMIYPQDFPQKDGTVQHKWVIARSGSPAEFVDRDPAKNGADKPKAGGTPALPVDQSLGNLEGKELRFGTSAGSTFAAATTAITCGSVNCMHDSLNPLAGIYADDGHVAELHLRRQGRGHDQHADLPDYRRVHRRPDGRADPRVPRQEGRSPRNEARHDRLAGPSHFDPHADRLFRGHGLGTEGHEQSGGPRVLGGALRVQFGFGEQRFGIRGPDNGVGLLRSQESQSTRPRRIQLGTSPRAW